MMSIVGATKPSDEHSAGPRRAHRPPFAMRNSHSPTAGTTRKWWSGPTSVLRFFFFFFFFFFCVTVYRFTAFTQDFCPRLRLQRLRPDLRFRAEAQHRSSVVDRLST